MLVTREHAVLCAVALAKNRFWFNRQVVVLVSLAAVS